jgi:hypothetical protein
MFSGPVAAFVWLSLLALAIGLPVLLLRLDVPAGHLVRYVPAAALLALGLGRLCFHPARTWGAPLRDFLGCTALAAAAWLFLPPVGDVNLWAAWQEADAQVARVRALRIGDQAGFDRDKERRAELKRGFPELAWRLERAEDRWTEQTERAIAYLTLRVKGARDELNELWRRDNYEAIDAVCRRVWTDFHEEAKGLGQEAALRDLCDYYRGVVLLAKHASKAGTP